MKTAHAFKTGAIAIAMSLAASSAWAMEVSEFVDKVAQQNYAEIETSKLALEKGKSQQVNEFAQKMIEDHRTANQELKQMAQEKNIQVPDDATLMARGKAMMLQLREGQNFDQGYVNNQVAAHEQTIQLFEEASKNLQDEEMRKWAEGELSVLREHYEQAKQLQTQTGAQTEGSQSGGTNTNTNTTNSNSPSTSTTAN